RGATRLTDPPASSPTSVVIDSVWFITLASKAPSDVEATVRQAPLTDTESPDVRSAARPARTRRRAPSSLRSTPSTVPISRTMPVNMADPSPLPQAGANQQVPVGALPLHRHSGRGVGDQVRALPAGQWPGSGAAEHDRGDEQP